jgi:hypothetical protein
MEPAIQWRKANERNLINLDPLGGVLSRTRLRTELFNERSPGGIRLRGIYLTKKFWMGEKMKVNRLTKGFLFAALLASSSLFASPKHHNKWDRKVAITCARAKGIVLPNKNTQLNASQLSTMHSCQKQYRANLQTCLTGVSISLAAVTKDQVPALRKCEAEALGQIK